MSNINNLPDVSFIIPSMYYSRPKNKRHFFKPTFFLPQTLEKIKKNVTLKYETIVICNGTSDANLVKFVQSSPLIDKSCVNSVNVGVSRAWNMGAMMAEGKALCFVNDDVEIGIKGIEALYEALMNDEQVGQVGSKGAKWNGLDHDRYVGMEEIEEADAISGFLFMIKTGLFFEVGGFDITFTPAGYEEIDMSFRIRKLGKKCVVVPNLDIAHYHYHGISAYNAKISYLNKTICAKEKKIKNRAYFTNKWNLDND